MRMRYSSTFVGAAVMVAVGFAQGAEWPLSRWQVYRVANGQPVGPPLPDRAWVWPAESLIAIVDTTGMAAAGIIAWQWRADWTQNAGYGPIPQTGATRDSFLFKVGNDTHLPDAPSVAISLTVRGGGGQEAISYRLLQPYSTWATLGGALFWACPGGEARVVIDYTTTHVDSVRVELRDPGGAILRFIIVQAPTVWRFPAPTAPGTYPIQMRFWVRGQEFPQRFPASLSVGPKPPTCSLILPPRGCVGQPIDGAWDPGPNRSSLPVQVAWDFNGDGGDAVGLRASFVYTTPGTYTIRAFGEFSGGCRDTLQGEVVVEPLGPLSAPTLLSPPSTYELGRTVVLRIDGGSGRSIGRFGRGWPMGRDSRALCGDNGHLPGAFLSLSGSSSCRWLSHSHQAGTLRRGPRGRAYLEPYAHSSPT